MEHKPIAYSEIPEIATNLEADELHQVIPKGFEDLVSFEVANGVITISFSNADLNASVKVPATLTQPEKYGTYFPQFLIEHTSIAKGVAIDYFNGYKNCVLNQNQMLYWIIQHRLTVFSKVKKQFAYLLNRDIKALMEYIGYVYPKAYNAKKRVENTWAILSVFDARRSVLKKPVLKQVYNTECVGDVLSAGLAKVSTTTLRKLAAELPIHPSSESSLSKKGKLVVKPYDQADVYRSIGYKHINGEIPHYLSIFPPKQNVPARLKTHLISDAYPVVAPDESVFMQDYIPDPVLRKFVRKDDCLKRALVVFCGMDRKTLRFVGGEIEASIEFVKTKIWKDESIVEQFEEVALESGKTYPADKNNKVFVGIDIKDEPVYIKNTRQVKCLSRQILGAVGSEKIRYSRETSAGNARIDSNTGIKGVTKAKPNLGCIDFPSLNLYKKPDLVVGMNAVKAKHNTIVLAQAALAVEMGLYTPKLSHGKLDTLDPEEINAAAKSLPAFIYTNEFGEQEEAYVGVCYVRFTELGMSYKDLGMQSFMFTTGQMLYNNNGRELFDEIWKTGIDPKYYSAIIELQKIIDDKGNSFPEDKLPRYSAKAIFAEKTLSRKDLVQRKNDILPTETKLLDPEWNKGFYLDLTPNGGKAIRFPSANLLNLFVSQLPDKTWIYPSLLIIMSTILGHCMRDPVDGTQKLGYIFDKNSKSARYTDYRQYMNEVKTVLYSGEDSAQMMIQRLIKPELFGFSMKQMIEPRLPKNTVCLLDDHKVEKLVKYVYGEDADLGHLMHGLIPLQVRNPVLWEKQLNLPRFWNSYDFSNHLMENYGITLSQYLCLENNKDIVLVSTDVALNARSDTDGDLSPFFFVKHDDVSKVPAVNLARKNLTLGCEYEEQWLADYVEGELEANDSLIDANGKLKPQTYTLYALQYATTKQGKKKIDGYSEFLLNAAEAKAAIGMSTNDGWVFSMLVELYRKTRTDSNGSYVIGKNSIDMFKISDKEAKEMNFTYIRGLQDFVVTAVKHTEGGSQGFEILYLKNMHKPENSKLIQNLYLNEFKLAPTLCSKILSVITWAEASGCLSACNTFLRLYNKGVQPTDKKQLDNFKLWEKKIQETTFFGYLIKPIYDVKQQVAKQSELNQHKISAFKEEMSDLYAQFENS